MSLSQGSVFSHVDHEVFLITASHDKQASGMVVTWVLPASMQAGYPKLLFLAAESNYTFELLKRSGRFVMHLLAEDQIPLMERFGLESGRSFDKFEGLSYKLSAEGDRILENTAGYALCQVEQIMALPERLVVVADVSQQQVDKSKRALSKKDAFSRMSQELLAKFEEKQRQVAALSQA